MKKTMRFSSSISLPLPSSRPRLRLPLLFVIVATLLLLLLSTASSTFANSATWKTNPATGDWNHAANWIPRTIPNGPSDTATFATSNTTNVFLSANIEVNGIVFNAGASAIGSGGGFGGGGTEFHDSSTAGNAGFFNQGGFTFIRFFGNSTAGNGNFNNGGRVSFSDASTAGNGTFFTNNGTLNCEPCAGSVQFF